MEKENINDIIADYNKLIANCNELSAELKAMDIGKEFLIKEYKTNKRYFRTQPGRVTIEDVIKTSFEFGWASKNQFEHDAVKKQA